MIDQAWMVTIISQCFAFVLVFLVLAKTLELTPLKINYAKSLYSPEIPWHGCCTEEKTLLQFQAHYSMDNCQEPVDRCHWNSRVLKGAMSRTISGLILKLNFFFKIYRNLKVIIQFFLRETTLQLSETVNFLPLSWKSRMEMDYNLKKLANFFKFTQVCSEPT